MLSSSNPEQPSGLGLGDNPPLASLQSPPRFTLTRSPSYFSPNVTVVMHHYSHATKPASDLVRPCLRAWGQLIVAFDSWTPAGLTINVHVARGRRQTRNHAVELGLEIDLASEARAGVSTCSYDRVEGAESGWSRESGTRVAAR